MKRAKWYHYFFFLMGLAVLSRVLTDKDSPNLIQGLTGMLGNLFKGTING